MKRVTFLEIVKVVTRSQSTSLAALDNENFANVQKVIAEISARFQQDSSSDNPPVAKMCDDTENFSKHLETSSPCASHCIQFGLAAKDHSKLSDKSAFKACDHNHDQFCRGCDLPYLLFEELDSFVDLGAAAFDF